MNDETVTEKLAAALHCVPFADLAEQTAALLPIVREIAAEELRAAADAAHDEYSGWEAAAVVRARADALSEPTP